MEKEIKTQNSKVAELHRKWKLHRSNDKEVQARSAEDVRDEAIRKLENRMFAAEGAIYDPRKGNAGKHRAEVKTLAEAIEIVKAVKLDE